MNTYERSKPLFNLCQRSFRLILLNICCKFARPVEAKFHVELLWVERTKMCSNGHGHVTKMAAMPIYGKNSLKFFSKNSRPITFALGIQHQRCGPYNGSNDDPGLTLTYFTEKVNIAP